MSGRSESEEETLRAVLDRCGSFVDELENSSSGSVAVQARIGAIIGDLEQLTRQVSSLALVSCNEDVEELGTSSLPFLLLPAFLGHLSLQQTSDRLRMLENAEVYYRDFLQRLECYGIYHGRIPSPTELKESKIDLKSMQRKREEKIQKFKESQVLKKKIESVRERIQSGASVDEEILRDLYLAQLKWWSLRAVEELETVNKEKPLVAQMESLGRKSAEEKEPQGPPAPAPTRPLAPVILTRTEMQKKVFGYGYPSIPTMTIDEWAQRNLPSAAPAAVPVVQKDEDQEESDSAVARARLWDQYRDDHRTGWGNTYNKG